MAGTDTPTRGGTIRGWRALVLLASITLLPALAAAGAWVAAARYAPLPGLAGCQYVREREAQLGCYSDRFAGLVGDTGVKRALATVDAAAGDSTTLGADCHLAWHPVGEAQGRAAARAGRGYANIHARTTCQQGFAHGYTIGYLGATNPSEAELLEIVRTDCAASGGLTSLFNCVHAYGHTIARRHPKDVAAGIRTCERVDYRSLPGADVRSPIPGEAAPVVVGSEHQCLYGLYMEYGIIDVTAGNTTLDNCSTATSTASRKACYAYLPGRVGAISGELPAAARSCHELAPAGDLRDSCVKTFSIGLDRVERCTMLVAAAERAQCRTVFVNRGRQEQARAAVDGDVDSFDTTGAVKAPTGVAAPAAPGIAPGVAPPS